jgi:serine/threonine protein kinase
MNPNYRGTLRYASPRTHQGFELCRADDLISLLFILVEMHTGKLPWMRIMNKVWICFFFSEFVFFGMAGAGFGTEIGTFQ